MIQKAFKMYCTCCKVLIKCPKLLFVWINKISNGPYNGMLAMTLTEAADHHVSHDLDTC